MTSFIVASGVTQTTRVDMTGSDDLTVQVNGALQVDDALAAVVFSEPTAGGLITNNGAIRATGEFTYGVGFFTGSSTLSATINNNGDLSAEFDAIGLSATFGLVNAGEVSITNSGGIVGSAGTVGTGNAIDFSAATGGFLATIVNDGSIFGVNAAAIVIGGTGNITNNSNIAGGFSGAFIDDGDAIVYAAGATGTVTNNDVAVLQGDRHGINAGANSAITVVNNGQINGFNGTGIRSLGSVNLLNFDIISGLASVSSPDLFGPGGVPDGTPDTDTAGVHVDGQITVDNFGGINGFGASGHGADNLPNTAEGIHASGGDIINRVGGNIFGQDTGILIASGRSGDSLFLTSISNSGAISSNISFGIQIIGNFADTITNLGTISGGGGTAILFGSGNNTLFVGDGSVINGLTDGGNGSDLLDYSGFTAGGVTVDLAAGTATATGGVVNFENIVGSTNADVLQGNSDGNFLTGGLGVDKMEGRDGNDTFFVSAADFASGETYDGGTGNDTFSIIASGNYDLDFGAVDFFGIETLAGADPGENGGAALRFRSSQIGPGLASDATVDGTGFDDVADRFIVTMDGASLDLSSINFSDFIGPNDDVIVNGTGTNETIIGSFLADIISGGDGNDTIEGGAGGDVLSGGLGTDRASYEHAAAGLTVNLSDAAKNTGQAAGDTYNSIENLTGSAFKDNLTGTNGGNSIIAGAGDDTVFGLNGDDNLFGQDGNDVLNGGVGADALSGGAGSDRATYENATAGITAALLSPATNTGEAAGDTFTSIENLTGSKFGDTLKGTNSTNSLIGGEGGDTVVGFGGDDNLFGQDGNDVLNGGAGADALSGGAGSDRATYESATAGVTAALLSAATNTGEAAGETYISIENLTGSKFDDTLKGTNSTNSLIGGAGGDTVVGFGGDDNLYGQDGNDVLNGGLGADALSGGLGSDRATYESATVGVTAALLSPATNTGEAAGDTFTSIENLTGSAFDDTLKGTNSTNSLIGGAGADALSGGLGSDRATYENATAGITAALVSAVTNTGEAAGDIFTSIENLTGSGFDDTLTGTNGANSLIGGAGKDTIFGLGDDDNLFGQDGNDVLNGGLGADALSGGNGLDTASYGTATAGLVASLTTPALNTGDAAGDTYSSIENLTGSGFGDTLTGNSGANVLLGGNGDDTLNGRLNHDVLTGGAGKDSFLFDTTLGITNIDSITDFSVADDTIRLENAIFTALTTTGVLSASMFKDNFLAPRDADDRILYNSNTGSLFYDADGLGASFTAVKFASLAAGLSLTAADFVVV